MSTQDYTLDDCRTAFYGVITQAVALRIARTAQTNPTAAKADYDQHVSAMDENQRALFDKWVTGYAIEFQAAQS